MKQPLLLLFLFPALELIAAGPPHDNDSDPVIHRVHNKLAAVKNISKRDVCPENKYPSGDNCCAGCEPGYFKDKDCTAYRETVCKKCKEGEEYTDVYNYLSNCRRCTSCDAEHGLEVDKLCSRSQNVKCRCKPDFFSNSSEPYAHCDPCSTCEGGIIVEECTRTKDTTCKPNLAWISGIVIPLVLGIIVLILIYWNKKCREQNQNEKEPMEMNPLVYPDIDLTPHISDIAEEMTLEQVLKFVRSQRMLEPTIERIILDNMHDTSEKKIKLLENWFQRNGITGAYGTLISCLKYLHLLTLAEKIEQKMASHIQNNAARQTYQNITSFEESSHV